jgi:hypothetical protein
MGHARALAERIDLPAMTPQPALTETAYCLASPGVEYLVYGHNAGTFWVDLSSGSGRTFTVEWIDPRTGEVVPGAAYSAAMPGSSSRLLSETPEPCST